jgi:hypothetical protein
VAGVFEKAVEARGDAGLDTLDLLYKLGEGAADGQGVTVPEGDAVV